MKIHKDNVLNFSHTIQGALIEAIGNFGHSLLQKLNNDTNNIVISPLSVYSIMAMLTIGSQGSTRYQLEKITRLHRLNWTTIVAAGDYLVNILDNYQSDFRLNLANRVYVTEDLIVPQLFLDSTTFGFGSKVVFMDFKKSDNVVAEMNHFVNLATRGKIKKIVDGHFTKDTTIAIVSAVFFEGAWRFPVMKFNEQIRFNAHCESPKNHANWFKISGRMAYGNSSAADAYLLRVPYNTGIKSVTKAELLIALPKSDSCNIDRWLEKRRWIDVMRAFHQTEMTSVELLMPKINVEWVGDLRDSIKKLGILVAFEKTQANFSKMVQPASNVTTTPLTYLNRIFHRTSLSVSDLGTSGITANSRPRRDVTQASAIQFEVKSSFYLAVIVSELEESKDQHAFKYMQVFAGLIKTLT
ncbi:serpin B6-like isoform X2 [Varroa destructor]|uniref:Serpin domain-containing protein n=1 Tax=Varroa destructor TaxID=109461 RepID=A0A7M7K9G5_VARDE|nr:serpin B6-like isoform X2 [Varroa destructor]